jgi:hypothetical protein
MQPMPRVPLDRPATYDDLIALPENLVAEIVDGELWASPHPAPKHTRSHSSLAAILTPPYDHRRGGPGGWWTLIEPEVHLGASERITLTMAGSPVSGTVSVQAAPSR